MTYTAENIANIKRYGQLPDYIGHARRLIADLESATVEFDTHGQDTVSLAHLYGSYWIDTATDAPCAVANVTYDGKWQGRWSVASFDGDQNRAMAYARAALRNKLTEDAAELLSEWRRNLKDLEAAL